MYTSTSGHYICVHCSNNMYSQYCVDETKIQKMFAELEDLQLEAGEVIVTIFDLGNSIEELGDSSYKAVFQNTETIMDVKTRFCTDMLTDDDESTRLAVFSSPNGRRAEPAINNTKILRDIAKQRHVRLWVSMSRR